MAKINKSAEEAIMICIDTSGWMENKESSSFKEQTEAIRFYCTQKIKSNPKTVVGISGIGDRSIKILITPTRNIDLIMSSLSDAKISGDLVIVDGIAYSYEVWFFYGGAKIGLYLPKRMVVFAGGPLYYEKKGEMEELGQAMKEMNVACDAVIFGDAARDHKELFDTLITAADNNGNCNLVRVPPKSTVLDALFRSLNVGASETSSVADLDLSRLSLDLKLDNANPNGELDIINPNWVTCDENWEPLDEKTGWETLSETGTWELDNDQKTGTWSQSSLDFKLDNAAETLDQKIERLQRELDSLIQQKNQQVAC